jgi:hypothetical protein
MYDESRHIPVLGSVFVNIGGTADTSSNRVQWWSHVVEQVFHVVPASKPLTITDVLVNTEELTASHTVYMNDLFPDNQGGETIFELRVQPNATPQAHFLTGYVIQPGHTVVASTLPVTPPPNETIRVWLTGYLPNPWVFWRTRPNVPPMPRAAMTGGQAAQQR